MNLTAIRRHLAELDMTPSKSLGQNFLHDQNLAQWMVRQADPAASRQVIEIGPGLGALTEYVAPLVQNLTLVEKDGRLAGFLTRQFADQSHVHIHHEDACHFDIRPLFPSGDAILIGNLPYYVSTAIILNFLSEPTPVRTALFTLQREVAERLSAAPGTGEYGSLTLAIQRRWKVKYLRTLSASVFYPEPKVESAAVLLTARPPGELPTVDGNRFESIVRQGFSQRRKQVRKTLNLPMETWEPLAGTIDCPLSARAEELSLHQWIDLVNLLTNKNNIRSDVVAREIFDVVDQDDIVIRQSPRGEVHENDWLHRAVHIFVFNALGELFLQLRSHLKDRQPGKWDSSAAGHVDAGEDYLSAANREIMEELGVSADLELMGRLRPSDKTGFEFIALYLAVHEGPFQLQPDEIECGAFFSLHVIRDWIHRRPEDFAPGFIECFSFLEGGKG